MIENIRVNESTPELTAFLKGCSAILVKHFQDNGYKHPVDEVYAEYGSRYVRVMRRTPGSAGACAHCFVDRTNGDVLKAASWKAPAKHARGNIFSPDNGLSGMGPYGAVYLR